MLAMTLLAVTAFQDKLDIAKFELAILSMRFTLGRYLGPQPLQILGKLGAV